MTMETLIVPSQLASRSSSGRCVTLKSDLRPLDIDNSKDSRFIGGLENSLGRSFNNWRIEACGMRLIPSLTSILILLFGFAVCPPLGHSFTLFFAVFGVFNSSLMSLFFTCETICGTMEFLMVPDCQCDKIFRSIISWITINMVDCFIMAKSAVMCFLPDKPMFNDISGSIRKMVVRHIKKSITIVVNLKTFPIRPWFTTAIMTGNETNWIPSILSSSQRCLFGNRRLLTATTFTKTAWVEIWGWFYGFSSRFEFIHNPFIAQI